MDRGLARVVVVRVHHEFHMKHLLPPTHLHERLRFPWPVSIRGWTLRISSSKRLRDSLITSSLGSTLRALQVLPLHRHHHQTHRCLFMFSYITWSRFLILIVYHIYIYIYIYISYFSLSLVCFPVFMIHLLYHFCDKKGEIIEHLIHLNMV